MIISMAYEYYDKKKELYDKYIGDNIVKLYALNNAGNDMEKLRFEILDKITNNVILTGTYSTMGLFNTSLSLWYWGWAIPFPVKSENYLSRKLLLYAMDIDIYQDDDSNMNSILKAELLNSKMYMKNPAIEIEKYVALAMYVTKSDFYHKDKLYSVNAKTNKSDLIGEVYYFFRDIEIMEPNV